MVSLNTEASSTWVSDVSVFTTEVRRFLVHEVSAGSPSLDDSNLVVSHLLVDLGSNSEVSLLE